MGVPSNRQSSRSINLAQEEQKVEHTKGRRANGMLTDLVLRCAQGERQDGDSSEVGVTGLVVLTDGASVGSVG